MGERWTMNAGRRQLYWGKNYIPDAVALLFTDADLTVAVSPTRDDETGETFTPEVFRYRGDVLTIRARLELQGFTPSSAFDIALSYINAVRSDPEESIFSTYYSEQESSYLSTREMLIAVIEWAYSQSRETPPSTAVERHLETVWRDLVEGYDDPRFAIALLLHGARANTSIAVDLSGYLMGGWLEPDERPHITAHRRLTSRISSSGAVIVVTEGSTDAQLLSRALQLAETAVAHQFTFMDFSATSGPGGVDQVERLTRSLAAAGVVNRVVAILDNDTAGNEAKRRLDRLGLPPHFAVRVLPDIALARNYPTVGPEGPSHASVNGRAVTIEMSFGREVLLAGGNGRLPPVRWGGTVGNTQTYQGGIDYKTQVQRAIKATLDSATVITDLPPETARSCRALAQMILGAAMTSRPMMASEYSPLL
ncbi:HEPN/Toprim-associated domain-containing protein [Cryobacterium sp. RTC2.1]|uniref:HEPN/Toprim-associated domain-containing protein n=1 Tax=Cryobacterium sp. RTC2.1 TaxID=3048634 RepID=UPI002B23CCFC|nr:HEPN/Toprim-associated domain-containing protein [Cryobacterium sp. RTC2.1]MEB0004957.1 HEPN/Toprim-associated domain-containing protein [Cryobacterium sp. RTC2.1]